MSWITFPFPGGTDCNSGTVTNAGLLSDDYSWKPVNDNDTLFVALDAARTVTLQAPDNTAPISVSVYAVQDGGSGELTFAGISTPGGIAPQLGAADGNVDCYKFDWNGSAWVLVGAAYDVQEVV